MAVSSCAESRARAIAGSAAGPGSGWPGLRRLRRGHLRAHRVAPPRAHGQARPRHLDAQAPPLAVGLALGRVEAEEVEDARLGGDAPRARGEVVGVAHGEAAGVARQPGGARRTRAWSPRSPPARARGRRAAGRSPRPSRSPAAPRGRGRRRSRSRCWPRARRRPRRGRRCPSPAGSPRRRRGATCGPGRWPGTRAPGARRRARRATRLLRARSISAARARTAAVAETGWHWLACCQRCFTRSLMLPGGTSSTALAVAWTAA